MRAELRRLQLTRQGGGCRGAFVKLGRTPGDGGPAAADLDPCAEGAAGACVGLVARLREERRLVLRLGVLQSLRDVVAGSYLPVHLRSGPRITTFRKSA